MSFIRATGQTWRFALPLIVTTASGAAIGFQFPLARILGTEAVYVAFVSAAVAVPAFLLMVFSVRCPRCGLRIVWYGVSKKDHREWFTWVTTLERCPGCGYAETSE